MKKIVGIILSITWIVFSGIADQINDPVENADGWILAGGGGSFDLKDQTPTAGSGYFNLSITPGTTLPYNNRAAVKDLGITLQAGVTYTITGDFNQSFLNRPFIGDAFTTATSDQVAFGLFVTNGIDFNLNTNAERQKIRDGINAVMLNADSSGGLTWTARTIPDGTAWRTWSYTLKVAADSPYAGQSLWFGIYGGHIDGADNQNSLAFDNLKISFTPKKIRLVVIKSN